MNITGREIEAIIELDRLHFPLPWSRHDWEKADPNHHKIFSWYENDQVIGFALFHFLKGDETAHLLKICVSPSVRGTSASAKFWTDIVSKLKLLGISSIYLEVEEGNHRARGFYQKVGFSPLRTIKGYYSDGSNAVTMSLTL